MQLFFREAITTDEEALLEYLKKVGSESEYLSFGKEGIGLTISEEETFLSRISKSDHSRMFLALDNNTIVGNAFVKGNDNPRFAHNRSLSLTVVKAYWGNGIGSSLLHQMIAYSLDTGAEILSLQVRSDNYRAISLYKKFGFSQYGFIRQFYKINDVYYDIDLMEKRL